MYRELKRNFLAMKIRQHIAKTVNNEDISEVHKLIDEVVDSGSVRMRLLDENALRRAINTRANLNSDVLNEILLTVGFDVRAYLSKENLLDARLLGSRNRIAHGERVEIDALEYFELHRTVIELMERFKSDVQNSVSAKSYRV